MTELTFSLIGFEPMPKGSWTAVVRGGKPQLIPGGTGARRKQMAIWETELKKKCGTIDHCFEGPCHVDMVFLLPRPKAAKKRRWPHVRPDLDKLVRSTLDGMVPILPDDSRVVGITAVKLYAPNASQIGVTVTIKEMDDGI